MHLSRRVLLVLPLLAAIVGGVSIARSPHSIAATHAAIPAAAAWPTPQEETYMGCPPQGDGGDTQLNELKNRIDTGAWQSVPLSDLLKPTWPKGTESTRRSSWSSSDAATVAQNEGRPVQAEGYLLLVRHEGPESPNCHSATQRDYHTWISVSPGTTADRDHSLIAELTPRVVARNPGWGNQSAILKLTGQHVRLSGWLLLDQEHPEQMQKTRGTLWEIHPVMKIDVQQGGKWIDLETGKPDTGSASPPSSRPTATSTAGKPTSGALSVRVSVSPNPTRDGKSTTVTASTSPGASCRVQVRYASGSLSGSRSLKGTQTAGSSGSVSWTWRPSTRRPGPATASVTCTLGGKSATGTAQFVVQ
jgi:hypothetical protein